MFLKTGGVQTLSFNTLRVCINGESLPLNNPPGQLLSVGSLVQRSKNARRLADQRALKKGPLGISVLKGTLPPVLAMLTTLRVALRGP
jgi:hypothetical protein